MQVTSAPFSTLAPLWSSSAAKHNIKSSFNNPGDAVFEIPGSQEMVTWIILDELSQLCAALFRSGKGWSSLIQPVSVDSKPRSKIEFQAGWFLIRYVLPFSIGSGQIASSLLFLIHLLRNWCDSGYLTVYLSGWVIFKYFTKKKTVQ